MPYDPSYPAAHSPAVSAAMRAQLNSIVDLIGTIPVGPQGPAGPAGPQGPAVTSYMVDAVTTLGPGQPATVAASFDGTTVHFTYGIPQGAAGPDGPQGIVGPQGPAVTSYVVDAVTSVAYGVPATVAASFDGTTVHFTYAIPQGPTGNEGTPGSSGPPGPVGPAFTNFVVAATTTLYPGQPATVVTNFDGTAVNFSFGIPQGPDGVQGPVGPAGPMGEVTSAQLNTAIAGTPSNTNAIATLDIPISDPPTQSEVSQVLAKLNELIVGLRRP